MHDKKMNRLAEFFSEMLFWLVYAVIASALVFLALYFLKQIIGLFH